MFGASYKLENVPLRWYLTLDNLQKWNVAKPNPSNGTITIEGEFIKEKINFFKNSIRHVIIGAELFPESVLIFV